MLYWIIMSVLGLSTLGVAGALIWEFLSMGEDE